MSKTFQLQSGFSACMDMQFQLPLQSIKAAIPIYPVIEKLICATANRLDPPAFFVAFHKTGIIAYLCEICLRENRTLRPLRDETIYFCSVFGNHDTPNSIFLNQCKHVLIETSEQIHVTNL